MIVCGIVGDFVCFLEVGVYFTAIVEGIGGDDSG